ncbi:MAG: COP9 signalosome catalytic subunit rri1 [Phylliscum demangeonii]|nr:MAG: COP9 signalosome catalytic subunit rri1 [Phylliscum demangeonii]
MEDDKNTDIIVLEDDEDECENPFQDMFDPVKDALYKYDPVEHNRLCAAKPWATDPHHFTTVRISANALMEMVTHAHEGGSIEVMGLMTGYITHNTFVVLGAFRLPVEGTETRVNAMDEANEYGPEFLRLNRELGRQENAVGWYHSHPGYGCWLSGIDVETQHNQQSFIDPFVAIVIDPERTIASGKIDIGAFRTYPANYKPAADKGDDGHQPIPTGKVEDFGSHAHRYYPLEVFYFKSSLDTLILNTLSSHHWASNLGQNSLASNHDFATMQMHTLSEKMAHREQAMSRRMGDLRRRRHDPASRMDSGAAAAAAAAAAGQPDELERITKEGHKIATDEVVGMVALHVKARLFQDMDAEPGESSVRMVMGEMDNVDMEGDTE